MIRGSIKSLFFPQLGFALRGSYFFCRKGPSPIITILTRSPRNRAILKVFWGLASAVVASEATEVLEKLVLEGGE